MNAVQSTANLVIGQRVYCILYGGKYGTIYEIAGEQDVASIRSMGGGVMVTGGRADISVAWDRGGKSVRVPEAIVRGVQWRIFDEVVSAEKVAEALTNCAIYEAQIKAKAEEAVQVMRAAMDVARVEGQKLGLIAEADFQTMNKRGSAAAYNLRTELKKAGIKSSVKADGYNSLNVTIENDKDADAAKSIMMKYKAGRFDGMTDSYEYDSCAWGKVFGDVQYVFGRKTNGNSF